MFNLFFYLAVGMALADWWAVWRGRHSLRVVTKPGVIVLLGLWFVVEGGAQGWNGWVVAGLVAALAGDVFLLNSRFFLYGLGAFLLTHIFYILGFNPDLPPFGWVGVIFLAVTARLFWMVFEPAVSAGRRGRSRAKLLVPTLGYSLVLSLMFLSALLTLLRPEWPFQAAVLAAIGAGAFLASDTLLAIRRFRRAIRFGDLIIIVLYHLAQVAILTAVLMKQAA